MSNSDRPIIQGKEVSLLIPQKPPIEMVDTLWLNDDTTTISGFHIKNDTIFCKDGFFTEPGIIENIAQTAALRAGYVVSQMQKNGEHVKPPIGYIGAIKKLKIHSLPKVDETLRTEVVVQQIIFGVTLITAKSSVNGNIIAECDMKIFIKED